MTFTFTLQQDEDGMYVAECSAIPGCVSQGTTPEEAEKNIRSAIRECLVVRRRPLGGIEHRPFRVRRQV